MKQLKQLLTKEIRLLSEDTKYIFFQRKEKKFENINYLNVVFYKLQAYHVKLNDDLGRPQAPANVQEK